MRGLCTTLHLATTNVAGMGHVDDAMVAVDATCERHRSLEADCCSSFCGTVTGMVDGRCFELSSCPLRSWLSMTRCM